MSRDGWHILGAGAIGCLCAGALREVGRDVTLLLRETPASADGALVVERDHARLEYRLPLDGPEGEAGIDRLLISTKAYDVVPAARAIAHRVKSGTPVVLLVNGMGMADQLQEVLAGAHVFCGTTTEGAYRTGPLHVHHAGRGSTRIGRQGLVRAPDWFDDWSAGTLSASWDADIEASLWSKLAVNCVINPLTAVHRCRNGELARSKELGQQVDLLCREVMQVSYAAGFADTARNLPQTVAAVIAGTADNRSSMLEDVERGRETEIDFITGYLLQAARDHGIAAPHSRELYEKVKSIA